MSISVLLYQSLKLLHMNYTTALHITKFQVSFSSGRFSCLPDLVSLLGLRPRPHHSTTTLPQPLKIHRSCNDHVNDGRIDNLHRLTSSQERVDSTKRESSNFASIQQFDNQSVNRTLWLNESSLSSSNNELAAYFHRSA